MALLMTNALLEASNPKYKSYKSIYIKGTVYQNCKLSHILLLMT